MEPSFLMPGDARGSVGHTAYPWSTRGSSIRGGPAPVTPMISDYSQPNSDAIRKLLMREADVEQVAPDVGKEAFLAMLLRERAERAGGGSNALTPPKTMSGVPSSLPTVGGGPGGGYAHSVGVSSNESSTTHVASSVMTDAVDSFDLNAVTLNDQYEALQKRLAELQGYKSELDAAITRDKEEKDQLEETLARAQDERNQILTRHVHLRKMAEQVDALLNNSCSVLNRIKESTQSLLGTLEIKQAYTTAPPSAVPPAQTLHRSWDGGSQFTPPGTPQLNSTGVSTPAGSMSPMMMMTDPSQQSRTMGLAMSSAGSNHSSLPPHLMTTSRGSWAAPVYRG